MPRSILLLITDLQIGGTPTVVRELALRLNDLTRVTVDVCCLAGHGPVVDELRAGGIRTTTLAARGAGDWSVLPRLKRLIATNGYDTVFSFLVHANAAAAAVAPFCRDVRFLQSIQTTQPHPRWHWRVQSLVHHAADRIVVPSPSVAAVAQKWADIPADKISVIPNAIQLEDFSAGPRPKGSIGFIGRLDPIKRIPDLLQAMPLLDRDVHLHIFGQGSERTHIEGMIDRLQLSSRVTLHGSVRRPQEALGQVELLVLPSEAEGFGLVLIEAMAAGVPVVATYVPGVWDVVRNGQTGMLVPLGSPEELAKAISTVLGDRGLRERLIAQAHEDVSRRFTWDVVLPQYKALLGLG